MFQVVSFVIVGAGLMACQGGTVPPGFNTGNVLDHVIAQCAYGPRVPGSAARDSVAAYITRHFSDLGVEIERQTFTVADPYNAADLTLHNLTARLFPGEKVRVLVGSHYDSRPWADQEVADSLKTKPVPGAVDGATSTAILLELGRLLATSRPGIGVDLVFFDGEDYGKSGDPTHYCLGSRHYAATMIGPLPIAVIVLDMVGGAGTRVAREGYSQTSAPELLDHVFLLAASLGLDSFFDLNGPAIFDDHVPFVQKGLRAINLFGFDYQAWHTLSDTPDQVDRARVDQVGRLMTGLLWDFPR